MDRKQTMLEKKNCRFAKTKFLFVTSFGGRGKMKLIAALYQITGLILSSSTAVASQAFSNSFHSKKQLTNKMIKGLAMMVKVIGVKLVEKNNTNGIMLSMSELISGLIRRRVVR